METLSKSANPSFDYCEARYWLARNEKGEIVGRIAGIINNRAIEKWGQRLMRVGWVDFVDDLEVSGALFKTVEQWAKERGMEGTHGPLGFTDLDFEGLLVEGFDKVPTIANIYNYPYYVDHFEKHGFAKVEDWIQYLFNASQPIPEKVERINNLIMEKYGLRVLKFASSREVRPRAKEVFEVLNAAFVNLYGFVSLTDKEINYYLKNYFGFIKPDFVSFVADSNDKIIGFAISMPSLSRAFQKAKGRLFPFGFIHILKALRKNDLVDLYLTGVHPEWQNKGVHSIFYTDLNKTFISNNIPLAISNPQLESNFHALGVWKNYDKEFYIRRRCYRKMFTEVSIN
jgi:GNAT superfamily N-acetyltransferase